MSPAANEHDLNQLKNLLHSDKEFVCGDAGYQDAAKREELKSRGVEWLIAERPGKVHALKKHPRKNKTAINIEYLKALQPGESGASVSHHQVLIWFYQSSLQGTGEIRQSIGYVIHSGEPV